MAAGEIVGLSSLCDSGETTLLNVISGVLAPTSGRIFVGDRDVTKYESDQVTHRGDAITAEM